MGSSVLLIVSSFSYPNFQRKKVIPRVWWGSRTWGCSLLPKSVCPSSLGSEGPSPMLLALTPCETPRFCGRL